MISLYVIDSEPPSNIRITQFGNFSFLLNWDPPPNDVVDYRVFLNDEGFHGDGRRVESIPYLLTVSKPYARDQLTVRVRATNDAYWSAVAGPVTVTILCKYNRNAHLLSELITDLCHMCE